MASLPRSTFVSGTNSGEIDTSEYSAQLLPVRDDVVPWKSLNKVRLVKENDAMVLSISDEILALDQKSLRVQGFMIPLGVGDAFTALHYSTSVALECDGVWLLIDCPHPIQKMIREGALASGTDARSCITS